jgi:hypothetical protein
MPTGELATAVPHRGLLSVPHLGMLHLSWVRLVGGVSTPTCELVNAAPHRGMLKERVSFWQTSVFLMQRTRFPSTALRTGFATAALRLRMTDISFHRGDIL